MSKLFIIIGLPGSGKDTFLKRHKEEGSIVLSSDDIRNELFGREEQTNNELVFQTMNKRCKEYLKQGKTVYYNATNTNRKRRGALINEMKPYTDEINAVICLCSIGTILERNITRTQRHLPFDKLVQLIRNIDVPLYYEGYKSIIMFKTEEIGDFYFKIEENYQQDNPHHPETLQEHLMQVFDLVKKENKDVSLVKAACYHDIGKIYTREFNEKKGYSTYYNHEKVSAYLYMFYYTNIKENCPFELSKEQNEIATLIYHHMDKFKRNIDKTKELIGEETFKKLEILIKADNFRKSVDNQ